MGKVGPENNVDYAYDYPNSYVVTKTADTKTTPCYRKKSHIVWMVLVIALLAALICMIVLWRSYRHRQDVRMQEHLMLSDEERNMLCYSADCTLAAAKLLNNVDARVDPCEDFYEFACGRFAERHEIGVGEDISEPIYEISKQLMRYMRALLTEPMDANDTQSSYMAKTYYKACMDTDAIEKLGLQPLHELLNIIGPWPVLNKTIVVESLKWEERFSRLQKGGFVVSYDTPLMIVMRRDKSHAWEVVLGSILPGNGVHLSSTLLAQGYNYSALTEYEALLTQLAVKLGAEEETAATDMHDVVNFLIETAQLYEDESNNVAAFQADTGCGLTEADDCEYNTTIYELKQHFPQIDWDLGIQLLPPVIEINDNTTVSIYGPLENITFPTDFANILKKYSDRTIANVVLLEPIIQALEYLPDEYYQLVKEFSSSQDDMNILPSGFLTDRWKRCTFEVMTLLPNIASSLYVRQHFRAAAKQEISDLIAELKLTIKEAITTADWIDDVTKEAAIRKVNMMKEKIGYSENILNETLLFSKYLELELQNDTYFANCLELFRHQINQTVEMLLEEQRQSNDSWPFPATIVNAFYAFESNEIVFPAGILQTEFFNPNVPIYYNYGKIGSVVGHEISHGFDNLGSQYDEYGNKRNWWQNETLQSYDDRTHCFANQFNNIIDPITGLQLDGNLTLSENIADAGGLKIAYRAFQKAKEVVKENHKKLPGLHHYNQDQMFFIAYASNWCSLHRKEFQAFWIQNEMHALGRYRISEPLKNMQEFSDAFQCPSNSPMNPDNKCTLW